MKHNILRQNIVLLYCLIVLFIAISVLIGWSFDIQILKSILPNRTTMKANTAIAMILCALSLIYLSLGLRSLFWKLLTVVQSLFVIVLVIAILLQYLMHLDLGIDQLFYRDIGNTVNPGRMSPTTAFCFLNISIATLLLIPTKTIFYNKPISAALSTTAITISGLIFISYIPNLLFGYHFLSYANMGIHTALLFLLLGFSIFILIRKESDFRWVLNASITGSCIIWLLSLLTISIAYYNFLNQIKTGNAEIIQTEKVGNQLANIVLALQQFDINDEKYEKTGNKLFLENRKNAVNKIYNYLESTNKLPLINPEQQITLNQLKSLIIQKFNLTEGSLKTKVKQKISETKVSLNQKIAETLSMFQNAKEQLFIQKEAKQTLILNQALLLSPVGIFLSIAMLYIGLFILNSSILERKKIRANQRQLAEIVEFSDDGIISKDLNSVVTSWNAGAEHIFGYAANEIVGQSITKLIPPERVKEEIEIINKIKQGEKVEHFETVRIRKDGKPIEVSVTISPIKNAEHQIIGASKIVRDITEKNHLELQLRQGQKMSAIGQLTGGVAHDFNNLLGIILGNLDLLERNLAGNEEGLKRVKSALNAATRGADLTKRLLAFSRLQHLSPTPTQLNEPINNVVEMASRILGGNIEIITKLDSSIPPVLIDVTELESALINLAVNARDAMPNGGKLIFTTKLLELDHNYLSVQAGDIKPGTYACISLTDSGEGMPPEVIEHIFEPFFTTKGRGKGTGMGLSMVYGFVKQSGGIIRVYSEVGKGTTISLYLPFAKNIDIPVVKNKKINDQQKFSAKVLVVDDEVDLLEIASVYLKEMGFEVFHATDGTSALAIIEREPEIELLVTDIVMPGGMNGIDLAKKVRELKQKIIVVYTSGFPAETLSDRPERIEEILINKPYHRDVFVTTIAQVMTNNQD